MAWPAQHIHTYGRFDKEKGKTETKPDRRPRRWEKHTRKLIAVMPVCVSAADAFVLEPPVDYAGSMYSEHMMQA